MNYDAKSPSPSAADDERQSHDEARTADRRTPVNTVPTEADDGATANDWCAWCGRGPSTDEEDFDVDETWPPVGDEHNQRRPTAYDQLRFCSRSCLSRYKMDLFCRETQRYLHQLQVACISFLINILFLVKNPSFAQWSFLIIKYIMSQKNKTPNSCP